jgi:hypothetical protein
LRYRATAWRKLLHPSWPKDKTSLWRPKKRLSQRRSSCPRWCGSGYPRLQHPQRALIRSNEVKSPAMDYKRSARREATHFVESRISYREDNPIPGFSSLFNNSVWILLRKTLDLEWLNNITDIILGWIFCLDHKPFTWTILCYLLIFEKPKPKKFRTYLNLSSSLWCCGWLVLHAKSTRVEPRLVSRCY